MHPKQSFVILSVSSCIALAGCIALEVPPEPTATATPLTPSPTIAFPTLIPTSTFTPVPTSSPAPDRPSDPGDVIFSDDFSRSLTWTPAELAPGGLSRSSERLFISVRQANSSYMAISPADPIPSAFVEVDVRPELCTANDEFGLAFRISEDFEHYRFTLTCDGQARVVGVVDGIERVLMPNLVSSAIFPGLLLTNRLAVQMEGDQFRFYINGEEVFTDRDPSLPSGYFGLFVRARQSGQTTASFDNYSVRNLQPAPTSTPME